jgi:hypothetical protein
MVVERGWEFVLEAVDGDGSRSGKEWEEERGVGWNDDCQHESYMPVKNYTSRQGIRIIDHHYKLLHDCMTSPFLSICLFLQT